MPSIFQFFYHSYSIPFHMGVANWVSTIQFISGNSVFVSSFSVVHETYVSKHYVIGNFIFRYRLTCVYMQLVQTSPSFLWYYITQITQLIAIVTLAPPKYRTCPVSPFSVIVSFTTSFHRVHTGDFKFIVILKKVHIRLSSFL